MKLSRFHVSIHKGACGTEFIAWAEYKRGDMPTQGEFDYINSYVKTKSPNAELVNIKRGFVPASDNPTEVWWEFKWIAFDYIRDVREGGVR